MILDKGDIVYAKISMPFGISGWLEGVYMGKKEDDTPIVWIIPGPDGLTHDYDAVKIKPFVGDDVRRNQLHDLRDAELARRELAAGPNHSGGGKRKKSRRYFRNKRKNRKTRRR
jgi:hypothetical protein